MGTKILPFIAISVLLPAFALAGCASQSEVDQLRNEVSKAQATAEAARTEAAAAKKEASAATARAEAAATAAADVRRSADRMYRQSLRK